MITDAILDLLQAVVTALLDLVPLPSSVPDSSGWVSSTSEITSRAGWMSHFLPLDVAALCAVACIAWWLTCWAAVLILDLARRMRITG